MKTFIVLVLMTLAVTATAAIMGTLVNSQTTTTVTGQLAWKCTYNVMGNNVTVIVKEICPPSMMFE